MTSKRARQLLASRLPGGEFPMAYHLREDKKDPIYPHGITMQENEDIVETWLMLGHDAEYADAVLRIAQHGEVET